MVKLVSLSGLSPRETSPQALPSLLCLPGVQPTLGQRRKRKDVVSSSTLHGKFSCLGFGAIPMSLTFTVVFDTVAMKRVGLIQFNPHTVGVNCLFGSQLGYAIV